MAVIRLRVNGRDHRVDVPRSESLLTVLRTELDLTGAKYGCGEGQCGACTVLVDGQAVRSCVAPVSTVEGKAITTVEGLAPSAGAMHRVQQAFAEHDAMQCGYCTAGMIVSAVALLSRQPDPSEDQIVRAMNGNICRCGSHPRIVAAIRAAATAPPPPRVTRSGEPRRSADDGGRATR
jgi:aerobic-type carbon monoxide dehydrogenase small subunit (CoxS/CutS family)